MPEYNKGSGGKKDVNVENEEISLANKKEKDGKANPKEKNIFTKIKDFFKKIKPKKKSESNETPQFSPPKDARDIKEIEMESVAGKGATYHTDFEEQDEQAEVLKNLLERTKEPNIPDQQSVKVSDTVPATKQIKIMTIFPKDAQDSVLAQTLVTLANAMQMDHKSSKLYQQQLQFVIRLAAKSGVLEINNIHCLLSWAKTIYPNFIRKHLYEAQLGELLSTDEIRQLEDQYTQKQKDDLKKWWNKALEELEKSWKQNPSSLYEISHIILKMFMGVINSAKEIPDDFVSRVMPMVESEFLQFLNRYKSSFNNYQKKNRTKSNFTEIIMANTDYCSHFRDFAKNLRANEEEKQKINLILQEIEKKGDNILLQNVFKDEECNLRRLSKTKGLNSLEIMRKIISKAKNHLSSLSTLSDECRQVVAAKIHMHLVTKYLTEIKEIRNCDIDEQKSLATQMCETAKLLRQFSIDHLNVAQQSEAAWANDVIHKVANIIASDPKDLETIKLEVGALGDTCPDIRRRHVKSFLCIKKDLSNSQRISAVNMLNTTNLEDPQDRQLFTNIPCWPCHFLRFW
ncbi:tumor necrosis factor alpha-induced protein 2-like [Ranitomeya imitator]|uniref:tumor necrosis factor alpha-induced protein 2-like n=1 Tax=Ranitomeya imitator TaxID=111125 RepID=UPI0037E8C00C